MAENSFDPVEIGKSVVTVAAVLLVRELDNLALERAVQVLREQRLT